MSTLRTKYFTAKDIINTAVLKDIDDDFIVQDILPAGLTILAAGPKAGKSVLATQLAVSVASGAPLFGKYRVANGSCLYLSLEETPENMASRLHNYPTLNFQERITFAFSWNGASHAGAELLHEKLNQQKDCKLVVIDTYAMLRNVGSGRSFSYMQDYNDLVPLKDVAAEHGVTILLLHHTVKGQYKDWMSNLYGSTGIAGVADTTWFLDRPRNLDEAVLRIASRKTADTHLKIQLCKETRSWKYLSTDTSVDLSPSRAELILILGGISGPLQLKEIAKELRKGVNGTQKHLSNLVKQGLVRQLRRGVYTLADEGKKTYELLTE